MSMSGGAQKMKAERIRSKANKTRRTTDSLEEETRAMEERLAL